MKQLILIKEPHPPELNYNKISFGVNLENELADKNQARIIIALNFFGHIFYENRHSSAARLPRIMKSGPIR